MSVNKSWHLKCYSSLLTEKWSSIECFCEGSRSLVSPVPEVRLHQVPAKVPAPSSPRALQGNAALKGEKTPLCVKAKVTSTGLASCSLGSGQGHGEQSLRVVSLLPCPPSHSLRPLGAWSQTGSENNSSRQGSLWGDLPRGARAVSSPDDCGIEAGPTLAASFPSELCPGPWCADA